MTSKARDRRWQCPNCDRQFAKSNQWHSCEVRTVAEHFRGKDPELRSIFELLVRRLERSGPLRVDAVKSSINLISRHHFGGIVVGRDHLRIGFLATKLIQDPRIIRSQVLGPNRVGHSVIVRSKEELDAKLLRWLAAAQAQQA